MIKQLISYKKNEIIKLSEISQTHIKTVEFH